MATNTYAPKLPLDLNVANDDFVYISDALENIRQDLLMILFTNPGEKLMDPLFGVGIKKYLFEQTSGRIDVLTSSDGRKKYISNDFQKDILNSLTEQANKYNPEILIGDVSVEIQENTMFLKIFYNYKGFIQDSIGVSINI